MRGPRLIVREGAADLLLACLDIITHRERHLKALFHTNAQPRSRAASAEIIHGSLLTYHVLLLHAGMFMKEVYLDTAETILKSRKHRDALV